MPAYSKCWMTLLLVISSLMPGIQAQNLDSARAMAQTALQLGQYETAELLWMRVQYFSPERVHWETTSALAEIHFQQGRFSEAADEFSYAAHLAPHDSLQAHCSFRAAAAWLQVQDYAKVRERLQVMGPQEDSLAELRRQFYLGMAAYGMRDFVMAEAHWAGCTEGSFEQAQLHALFQEHGRLKPRHPKVAILLSALVPGLGQLYIGKPLKALNALVLVGTIVGGGIYVGAVLSIADAFLLFLPPFTRYYIGGARRASLDAQSKLDRKQQEVLEKMLDLLGE